MTAKRLSIKLGSQCNWSCPHCHNEAVNYPYNPKLLDFIRASVPRLSAEGAKRVMRELLEEAYAEAQDAAEC